MGELEHPSENESNYRACSQLHLLIGAKNYMVPSRNLSSTPPLNNTCRFVVIILGKFSWFSQGKLSV
jgi:hypothetical protein